MKEKGRKRHTKWRFWIAEFKNLLRGVRNSNNFIDASWVKFHSVGPIIHFLGDQERVMKFLVDPRICSILLSRNSKGSTSNLDFLVKQVVKLVVKGVVLLVGFTLISGMNKRNMMEIKDLYWNSMGFLPTNSGYDTWKDSFLSSNLNRLIVSFLHFPEGKRLSESFFMDPKDLTFFLPINPRLIRKKSIIRRGSGWWRNRIGTNRDSSYQISNETVVGMEISFQECNHQYFEFLFLSYTDSNTDELIREGGDWEFVDVDPRQGKNKRESYFCWNKVLREDLVWLANVWPRNLDSFFFRVWNVSSNILQSKPGFVPVSIHWKKYEKYLDSIYDYGTHSYKSCNLLSHEEYKNYYNSCNTTDFQIDHEWINQTEIPQLISRDHFDSIPNGDSKYDQLIDQTEIPQEESILGNPRGSFRSADKWSEFYLSSNPAEGYTRDKKLWNPKQNLSFTPFRRSEMKEMLDLFKILMYLKKNISIHSVLHLIFRPADRVVPKVVPKFEDRFQEMADLFILSITEPDLVYHRGFSFFDEKYFNDLETQIDRFMNRYPDIDGYMPFKEQPNFQEHWKHFLSKVFDRLRMNPYWMDWLEEEKETKLLSFFFKKSLILLPKSLPFLFVSLKNLPIARSEIDIYEWKNLAEWNDLTESENQPEESENQPKESKDQKEEWEWDDENWEDSLAKWEALGEKWKVFLEEWESKYQKEGWEWDEEKNWEWDEEKDWEKDEESKGQPEESKEQKEESKEQKEESKEQPKKSKEQRERERNMFLTNTLNMLFEFSEFLGETISSIGVQIVHLNQLMNQGEPFDHDTSPGWKGNGVDTVGSYFEMISTHGRYNGMNPVKAFEKGSLISSFYKANRLRFLDNRRQLWALCNKGFAYAVKKKNTRNADLAYTYRKFLKILFIHNKIFSLCFGKEKDLFLEISPIELQVSDIFLSNDFPKSQSYYYLLSLVYKLLLSQRIDPSDRRAIYSIADISERPLTQKQIAKLESTYYQSFLNRDLSDSEGKNLHQYLRFNSNMDLPCSEDKDLSDSEGDRDLSDSERENLHQYLRFNSNMDLIYTPCSEKDFRSGKRLKKWVDGWRQMYRTPQGEVDRAFSDLSNLFQTKWSPLKEYMPLFLTSTGCKYIHFLLFDLLSNSLLILFDLLSNSLWIQWVPIFHDIRNRLVRILVRIMDRLDRSVRFVQKSLWTILPQWVQWGLSFLSRVLSWVQIQRIGSQILDILNENELFYSILFFLLLVGYLAFQQVFCVSRASSELQTELEKIQSLAIPSYIMEAQKLWDAYPPSEEDLPSFLLKELLRLPLRLLGYFLGGIWNFYKMRSGIGSAYKVKSRIRFQNTNWTIKLIRLIHSINIIPYVINRIHFWIDTRHLSRASKEIDSWIRNRKSVLWDFDSMDEEIQFWAAECPLIHDEDRESLIQFFTLTTEKRMDEILLSLTHPSDHLSKNDSGYQRIEQPGSIYLRYIVDIHQKNLMNYEFNRSSLAERRIFLAHYQTITYSQTSYGTNRFHFPSHGNFSFRLALSPSRAILVIGSIGIGRSYLVKYLATNSYLPFITIFPNKFPYYRPCFKHFNPHRYRHINSIKDLDIDLRILTKKLTTYLKMKKEVYFDITLRLELAKAMSPCIIWIPNIHDLYLNESNYLSRGLLVNSLSKDSERCSTRNILMIASTHIPEKVDPALIAPDQFNTCIKIRRLHMPQQRKHFFILSYTRGFHLKMKKEMFDTNGFGGSLTVGSNVQDLVPLVNEALCMCITQKKSIIETDTIRSALHRQTWDLRAHVRPVEDPGLIFYQIGRAFAQNVFRSNGPLDPISIYIKRISCQERDLYEWYFELGTSMKRFTILLYLLSCSAGSVARDLWVPLRLDEKNGNPFYELTENDSYLAHSLLEVEGALVETGKDCSRFENNRMTLLLRSEPRNLILNGYSMLEKEEERIADASDSNQIEAALRQMEEDLFNQIVWAPRMWRPCGNPLDSNQLMGHVAGFFRDEDILYEQPYDYEKEDYDKKEIQMYEEEYYYGKEYIKQSYGYDLHEYDYEKLEKEENEKEEEEEELLAPENNPELSQNEILKYKMRSKERGFFRISQLCIWDPVDPFFSLLEYESIASVSVFLCREFFAYEDLFKWPLNSQIREVKYGYIGMFVEKKRRKRSELLIYDLQWLRSKSSLSSLLSFRSNTLSDIYQYLYNLFLSNERLLDQITRTLLRKEWLFPEEMKHLIHVHVTGERFPIP